MENNDVLLIGDVHGKVNNYYQILQKHGLNDSNKKTIQLGDFGFQKSHNWHIDNINHNNHKILFGNHDYYPYINKPHSLGKFKYNKDLKILSICGAYSIDKHHRTEGVDLFENNEQLTYNQFYKVLNLIDLYKPEIIISHDCPHDVRYSLFGISEKSTTTNGLQAIFECYQPSLWVFGHHHKSITETIDGTKFICLKELETILI